MTLDPATYTRLEVMALRVRLERLAARCFDGACDVPEVDKGDHASAKAKLVFVLADLSYTEQDDAYRAVRLARHVYARGSDVLHGRVDGLAVPPVIVQEWRDVVEHLESIAERGESWH